MNYPEIPNVTFLGDTHLGRRFMEGVPIERRGEREEMVWAQFEKELHSHNPVYHIMVGDLFDTFDVDNAVVLRAAQIYLKAAQELEGCTFLILRGNHDAARSDTRVSSFELFKAIVAGQGNIWVVDEPRIFTLPNCGTMGLMPWHPFRSAAEQAEILKGLRSPDVSDDFDFVVCHCDTEAWNGNDFNLLPLAQLSQLTKVVVTGHEHTKRSFKTKGVTVHVTGSMQPYSHGEDPEHTMYKTVSVDEMYALGDVSNFYLRVVLQPGETPPEVPNCLGYKVQLSTVPLDEDPDITVDFEEFDTTNIFKGVLAELKVLPAIQALVLTKFTESLNA